MAASLALAALLASGRSGWPQPIPPPPPNPGDAPEPVATPSPPRRPACPRCGYLCEPGWHYCVACGWDLTRLIGEAEENRLQSIARASVRVTVGGRRNRHTSAFPFGGPGIFLTNARVLIGADETRLKVYTWNNHEYSASVVGYDLPTGVGLLKADIPGLPGVEIAPASPAPSEPAWAVCYPIDLEDDVVRYLPVSLHRGHVTATGQTGTYYVSFENLLRTDHAIEDGCSGGPLVDSRGRIAGMILGSPDDGITYAQPLEGLAGIVTALHRHERPVRPFFGVGLVMPDARRRAKFMLDDRAATALIAYVIPGSPAAKAGVRAGDLLLAVGGRKIVTAREAGALLLAASPNAPGTTLTLGRGGAEVEVAVTPIARPERVMLDPVDEIQETLEANLREVTSGPGAQQGLMIQDVVRGGRGERDRYKDGDLIVSAGGKSVRTFRALNDLIRTSFKAVFADSPAGDKRFASSYTLPLEVRVDGQEKVTREYVNLFPDFLAPPVY